MSIIKSAEVDWWDHSSLKKLIDVERKRIIQCALNTPEGERALAQVMVELIPRPSQFQVIANRLIMVEELPQGALAYYDRNVTDEIIQGDSGVDLDGLYW